MILGAHTVGQDALAQAAQVGAECVQIFLGDPQSWRKPPPRPDADRLREGRLPVYVHAPYLINVASPNNRIRIPSRKILVQTLQAAVEIGAAGVIVHAGHAEDGVEKGFVRWRKLFEELRDLACSVPVLIENTAGGENAMARRMDVLAALWEKVGELGPGFCFDTCHAHAGGEDLGSVVERALAATGRIDLVHANSSRDPAGSGRDRHANFASGEIDAGVLWAMIEASAAPVVICETPWPGIAEDLAFLVGKRASLAAADEGAVSAATASSRRHRPPSSPRPRPA